MGKVTGQSPLYQWMNIAGAAGFVVNSGAHGAVPSAALNIVWLGIGAVALARLRWARDPVRSPAPPPSPQDPL